METLETLTQEIIDKLSELDNMSKKISSLSPVTYKSQSKIQWAGGIMGAIQESKERKRLNQLMNKPLIDGKSFIDIAVEVIPKATDYLVERQLKIQQIVNRDNRCYHGFVVDIFNCIDNLTCAWYNYSPEIADHIAYEENVALATSVNNWTKKSIMKLDLPQNIADHFAKTDKQQLESGGCLGFFVAIIVSTMAVLGGAVYGLYKIII